MRHLKTTFITMIQGDEEHKGMSKKPRKNIRANYKKWVKEQSCLITNLPSPDPHHLRNVNILNGTGTKPTDEYIIPLAHELHQELHTIGEKTFEKKYSIDLLKELEKCHNQFMQYAIENQEG